MTKELQRIMLSDELRSVVPFSDMHIRRLESEGRFPVRFKICSNAKTGRVGWWAHEVEAWLKERGQNRQKPTPQPEQVA